MVEQNNGTFSVIFRYSKEEATVSLDALRKAAVSFLEDYGEAPLLGRDFVDIVGEEDGKVRFNRLLKASRCRDAADFFYILLEQLEEANHTHGTPIVVNGIPMPYHFLLALLEVLIPGDRLFDITSVKQLQRLTNSRIPKEKHAAMQKVLKTYPVKFSSHTIRQMRLSPAVAFQYMPFTEELDPEGLRHTWVGQFHRGIVEQMYRNRIILILNMKCPVYCRFCFRKHKECRNQKSPTKQHVQQAMLYIRNTPSIKEIVLTGGDPFMRKSTLTSAVENLVKINHVQTIRVATRSISYFPQLFYADKSFWLHYLERMNLEAAQKDKKVEVATHFIHPDEISVQALDIISALVKSGIAVYVQTPLLGGCNSGGPELVKLYTQLRSAGAEIHYIFMPCSPIQGNKPYLTTIKDGLDTAAYLRAHLSDRAMPHITTATSIGKMDWFSSGWAVEQDSRDPAYIWLRTPYSKEYYEQFTPILQLSRNVRANADGTLDAQFMVPIGDNSLFRTYQTIEESEEERAARKQEAAQVRQQHLHELQQQALQDQRGTQSICKTGNPCVRRLHKTRAEIDVAADSQDLERVMRYISREEDITDVIIAGEEDPVENISRLRRVVNAVKQISHVSAIRVRSFKLNYSPEIYTEAVIKKLGRFNRLELVDAKRLEIETQFLHFSEFKLTHFQLLKRLRRHGLTVYNNTPLLRYINDQEEEILQISFHCREMGIEYNHIYVAGLDIQREWNQQRPISCSRVIDIATQVRKQGSGREIPRYILRTELGEVDFGLSCSIRAQDDYSVLVELTPYTMDYYKDLDPRFLLPNHVPLSQDGHPVVPVGGLTCRRLERW